MKIEDYLNLSYPMEISKNPIKGEFTKIVRKAPSSTKLKLIHKKVMDSTTIWSGSSALLLIKFIQTIKGKTVFV